MILKKATTGSPEHVFIVARNCAATTAVPGDTAQFKHAANIPGLDVETPNTNELAGFAGIWTDTVARSNEGLLQCYGYNAKIKMGVSSIALGDVLKLVADKSYMAPIILGKSAPGQNGDYDSHLGFVVSYTVTSLADSIGTTGPFGGFIRGM
jgi:hypothetical protein